MNLRHDMTKLTKWVCAQRRQISLGIRPVWSESSLCAQWVAKDPRFLHADSEDWSDWADVHAGLRLRWAHIHFVGFVMSRLIFYFSSCNLQKKQHSRWFCIPFPWKGPMVTVASTDSSPKCPVPLCVHWVQESSSLMGFGQHELNK